MNRRRLALMLCAALALYSATPTAWEMTSYEDFHKGSFLGVALHQDGRLHLASKLETLQETPEPAVWAMAAGANGAVYLATGHQGRLYRLDPDGKSTLLFTAPEPEIFAIALDDTGRIYAGTSPNGKVYRIENGKASEFFNPGAAYIWALTFSRDHSLFVATGGEGKLFRVTPDGKGELYYDTGQSHITSLAFDAQKNLLAGSDPNGILYRITAKDRAFVLYDSSLPEIRSIVPAPDGSIYAVAMGGSLARQIQPPEANPGALPSINTSTVTATVSVSEAAAAAAVELQPKPAAPGAASPQTPAARPPAPLEYSGVEKSAIYRIHADHSVETAWSSKEENAYDAVLTGQGLLFSTDQQGRLYRLTYGSASVGKITLVAETRQADAVRLLPTPRGVLIATANPGKLWRLGDAPSQQGSFESPVHDAGAVARWGRLTWQSAQCSGCQLQLQTRTGNSARPDKTWSDWSAPLSTGNPIQSPNARYIQWKAEFQAASSPGPELSSARLAYLPQNSIPAVKSIQVSSQTAAPRTKTQPAANATYTLTVSETPDAGVSSLSGTPSQPVNRATSELIVITWQAEDPDGDRLSYSLHYRGERETEWKLLKADLTDPTYSIDAEALADGRFLFRVTASDALSNPAATARQGELVSPPVLIDRTPPVLTVQAPARVAGAFEIRFSALDAASPLRSCEYSLDAGPWSPLAPEDGIIDSEQENFLLRVNPAAEGEHVLVIRAFDSAGNAALARLLLK